MICIHDKKTTKVNFDNNDFGIKEKMLQSSLRKQTTSLTIHLMNTVMVCDV